VVDVAVNVAIEVAVVPSMLLVFVNCRVTSYKLQYVLVGLMLMWDDVVYVAKAAVIAVLVPLLLPSLLLYWWWWLLPYWWW